MCTIICRLFRKGWQLCVIGFILTSCNGFEKYLWLSTWGFKKAKQIRDKGLEDVYNQGKVIYVKKRLKCILDFLKIKRAVQ